MKKPIKTFKKISVGDKLYIPTIEGISYRIVTKLSLISKKEIIIGLDNNNFFGLMIDDINKRDSNNHYISLSEAKKKRKLLIERHDYLCQKDIDEAIKELEEFKNKYIYNNAYKSNKTKKHSVDSKKFLDRLI